LSTPQQKGVAVPARATKPVRKRAQAPQSRPKIVRLTAEQRREQLLATAAQILVSRGFDALTMEAVGQESGASKTLGYAYFTNIEDLVLALWTQELGHLYDRVVEAAEGVDGFHALFCTTVEAYYDVVEERGVLLSVLQSGITSRRIDAGGPESVTADFVSWLAEQVRQEYDVDPKLALHFAVLAASVPSLDATARAGAPRDRDMERRCLDFIAAGIEAALRPGSS
jgi:AcrR family transcriptional regulator